MRVICVPYVIPPCYQDVSGLLPRCSASATTVNDMDQPEPPAPLPSLREALEASGARPNSRLSALSRYVLDHQDELYVLKVVERYSWCDIVAVLAQRPELAGISDPPLTVAATKLAWSRMMARKGRDAAIRSGSVSQSQTAPQPGSGSQTAPSRTLSEAPPGEKAFLEVLGGTTSDLALDAFHIHPAKPRGAPLLSPSARTSEKSASPLSADEASHVITELAMRQGGRKIPPPEIL